MNETTMTFDKQELLKSFPDFDGYPKDLQDELAYWNAVRLDTDLIAGLPQDELLEKARLIRWAITLRDPIDFSNVKSTPENKAIFDELTCEQLKNRILIVIYDREQNGKLVFPEPVNLTQDDIDFSEEKLIISVYHLKDAVEKYEVFKKGLKKDALDEVILALCNAVHEVANFATDESTSEEIRAMREQMQTMRKVKDPYEYSDLLTEERGIPNTTPDDVSIFKFTDESEIGPIVIDDVKSDQPKRNRLKNVPPKKSVETDQLNAEATDYGNEHENMPDSFKNGYSQLPSLDKIKEGMLGVNYRDGMSKERIANEFDQLVNHILIMKEAVLNSID